jgi:gliding motility-associated-like protein
MVSDQTGCSYLKYIFVQGGTVGPQYNVVVTDESCPGQNDGAATLSITGGVPPYYIQWSDPNSTTSASLENLPPGTYFLVFWDAQGCFSSDSIVIGTGTTCFNIPSSFTPNADLTNDTWVIKGINNFPNNTVEIYSRWGSLLFSSAGYAEPWDGTYQGQEVASATYYYIIVLSENDEPITGSVTVVR